ncbi:hypothetical protein [Pedobacter helvus]|uniref:Uncharacterized protein n=1 Tax=Pedobacter helvus TaxID=2563444 RepID=A0ABW9JC22_9SPHI|nr:hypothetical protein [Pedobacter ureilyticus]
METVLLQINNSKAYKLLKDLEDLNIIKVLKKNKASSKKASAHDFLGAISGSDIELMDNAIEEGCEKIDLNEWK